MIINYKGKKAKLPDFLFVGAARSGTTTLYHHLMQNPQIFVPEVKEPRFFGFMEGPSQNTDSLPLWRFEEYAKLFEPANDKQIIGEATTAYLPYFNTVIKQIKLVYGERYKDLKIIAILRNPVERDFSHYLYFVRRGLETLPFEEAINSQIVEKRRAENVAYDYLGYGMYYKPLKAYMGEFPHVKVYLFEDLKNPEGLIRDLFEFLGVDQGIEINMDLELNPSGIPTNRTVVDFLQGNNIFKDTLKQYLKPVFPQKYFLQLVQFKDKLLRNFVEKPEMDLEMRKRLLNMCRDDIVALQKLIARDLSHWLEIKN